MKITNISDSCLAEIKREFTKFHKEHFGKGPEDTSVNIVDNVLLIKAKNGYSVLEKALIDIPEGKEHLKKLRDGILNEKGNEFIIKAEEILRMDFKKTVSYYEICDEESYLFMVFDKTKNKGLTNS